jgi:hypothetical protein
MVTNLALPIQADTQTFSVPELRQRTVARMTGTEMGNWDFTTKPINVVCLENGAGYLKGHFYVTMNDGTVIDTFIKHFHASSADGGSLYDIYFNTTGTMIDWNQSAGLSLQSFSKVTGINTSNITTELSSNQLFAQFATGIVADDYINGMVGGGRLSFGAPLTIQVKYAMTHNTAALLKIGTGTTLIENAAGTGTQMGFEHCSASSVNLGVFSADGVSRQTSYMVDVVQANPWGLRLDYYPSSKIIARNGNGLSVVHTSNLPSIAGATNSDNLFRVGVKTTNTTQKLLKLYAARIFGTTYDATPGIRGWV